MVQIRKPVQLSENIIDLRVRRSPRGAIPSSVVAMRKRQQEDLQRQLLAEALSQALRIQRRRPR